MKLNKIIYFNVLLSLLFSFFLEAKDSFYTKSGNVIQGITYFENNWIFSQTHSNKSITFSIFNDNLKLRQTINIKYPSHAQDLSIVKYKDKLYLLTTGKQWEGVAVFELIKKNNKFKIVFRKNLKLSIGKNTPTISAEGNYLATFANNTIYIFDFKMLNEKQSVKPFYSFIIDKTQRQKHQWRQGISMKNNKIYLLSGDANIEHPKYLVVYDAYGKVLEKRKLKVNKQNAKKEGNKLEVEGLTFKGNTLYTTIMTGYNGKNKKQLLKIYKEEFK